MQSQAWPHHEISVLLRRARPEPAPSPRSMQQAVGYPGRGLARTGPCWHPELRRPSLQTERSQPWLSETPPECGVLVAAAQTETAAFTAAPDDLHPCAHAHCSRSSGCGPGAGTSMDRTLGCPTALSYRDALLPPRSLWLPLTGCRAVNGSAERPARPGTKRGLWVAVCRMQKPSVQKPTKN